MKGSGFRVLGSEVRGQRSDDRRQMLKTGECSNLSDSCFLSSVICLLTPDTRHLKPFILLNCYGRIHFIYDRRGTYQM
jgi:hypothetical protein